MEALRSVTCVTHEQETNPTFPQTHSLSLSLSISQNCQNAFDYDLPLDCGCFRCTCCTREGVVRAANRQHCPLTRWSVSPTSHILNVCCIPMCGEHAIHTLNLKSHNQNCQKKNGRKELESKSTEHDTKRYHFDCFGLDCCNSLKHLLTRCSTLRMRYVKRMKH